NGEECHYGIDDLRGASAIRDAVRAARALNRITKEEATRWAVDEHERARYIRIDRAKGNNAPTQEPRWLTFDNVVLPQGDDVGVLVLWQPPDASGTEEARNRAKHVFLAILQRFNGEGRKSSDAKTSIHYAPKVFAREREARDMCVGPA